MNKDTVTVIIKGVPHYFNGDELTLPEQQAIIFLKNLSSEKIDHLLREMRIGDRDG